jgi:hypothetical protein
MKLARTACPVAATVPLSRGSARPDDLREETVEPNPTPQSPSERWDGDCAWS